MEYIVFFIYTMIGFSVAWLQYFILKDKIYTNTDHFIAFSTIWPATLIIIVFFLWYGTEDNKETK